jgi:hypothetical protein
MVNDIKPMDAQNNLLVKFADDITTIAPVNQDRILLRLRWKAFKIGRKQIK